MIKIINIDNAEKSDILTRDIKLESGVEAIVADIIKNVRENGDKALKEYSAKFDGVCPENLRVTQDEIDAAYENEDKALIETLEMAKTNNANVLENDILYIEGGLPFKFLRSVSADEKAKVEAWVKDVRANLM